jgi:hypothetical protein
MKSVIKKINNERGKGREREKERGLLLSTLGLHVEYVSNTSVLLLPPAELESVVGAGEQAQQRWRGGRRKGRP